MNEQYEARKLTLNDLVNIEQNTNQAHSYKIVNNQKKYSHTQKVKP